MSLFRIVEPFNEGAAVTATEVGIGDLVASNVLTQPPREVFRVTDATALDMDFDLGATPDDFDTVGLIGATFSAGGTWEWREATSQANLTGSPVNTIAGITGRQATRENVAGWYHARVELPGTTRQQWQRVSIADPASPWQIGRVLFGLGLQFPREYQRGWDVDELSPRAIRQDFGLSSVAVAGGVRRQTTVQMDSIQETERTALSDLIQRRQEARAVWMMRDYPSDTAATEDSAYGLLTGVIGAGNGARMRVTAAYQRTLSVMELAP